MCRPCPAKKGAEETKRCVKYRARIPVLCKAAPRPLCICRYANPNRPSVRIAAVAANAHWFLRGQPHTPDPQGVHVPVITGIIPDARREGRLAVLVDGQSAAIVSLDDIERLNLHVGATIDPAALSEADADCALYDRALRLLAARSRSAAEIRRRLRRDGAVPDRIERVVGTLVSRGFLDDAAHARAVTRSRVRSRAASSRRIEQELARQGVAPDVATEAISEVYADEAVDESAVALAVARKRAAAIGRSAAPAGATRRLYGYPRPARHSPDIVRAAVRSGPSKVRLAPRHVYSFEMPMLTAKDVRKRFLDISSSTATRSPELVARAER